LLAAAIKAGDGQVADAKFNEKPEHVDRWRWRSRSSETD
jgi:hypothetical protein